MGICGLRLAAAAMVALAATICGAAQAEQTVLRIGRAPGVSYLNLYVAEHDKVIEKYARQEGVDLTVQWQNFTGGGVMNDALISGGLDIAAGGVPPFLILWSKTRNTRLAVKGIIATSSLPATLNTNNPKVRALRDFSDSDRISVAGVKNSQVAIILQMAAEREFGEGHAFELDRLTVGMPQPDSLASLLSGRGITAHFTVPPFAARELADPKIHKVLGSFDVLGGPATLVLLYASQGFHDKNAKLILAIREAFGSAAISRQTRKGLLKSSPI